MRNRQNLGWQNLAQQKSAKFCHGILFEGPEQFFRCRFYLSWHAQFYCAQQPQGNNSNQPKAHRK